MLKPHEPNNRKEEGVYLFTILPYIPVSEKGTETPIN